MILHDLFSFRVYNLHGKTRKTHTKIVNRRRLYNKILLTSFQVSHVRILEVTILSYQQVKSLMSTTLLGPVRGGEDISSTAAPKTGKTEGVTAYQRKDPTETRVRVAEPKL